MAIRYFDPRQGDSVNQRFREKRFIFFKQLFDSIDHGQTIRILDVGGTESYWEQMRFADRKNVFFIILNLEKEPVTRSNFLSLAGDARHLSNFPDRSIDIVYSNSVIEHLFTRTNQQLMADEIRRVGRNYYVQTPNRFFPIEPHWILPFFQFLPFSLKVALTQRFSFGHYPKTGNRAAAVERVREIRLLTEPELRSLFPEAAVYREYFLGLKKSFACYHFPGLAVNQQGELAKEIARTSLS